MKRVVRENINTKDYWDGVYAYVEFLFSDAFRYNFIASQLVGEKEVTVLDIGCGNGRGCDIIKKNRPLAKITGIDFSEKAIADAKEKYPEINFHVNTSDKIQFPDESFDYVIASEVLEHLDRPQVLVNEMHRLTKKFAILTTPITDHVPSIEHVWEFKFSDIQELFKNFSHTYILPWASQRRVIFDESNLVKYPIGNYDTFYVLAVK